jgi:general secretion pathway protein D
MKQRSLLQTIAILFMTVLLWGCANFSQAPAAKYPKVKKHQHTNSYTLVDGKKVTKSDLKAGDIEQFSTELLRTAPLLRAGQSEQTSNIESIRLPKENVSLNADKMPLESFINLALGDVLKVNYIVDADLLKQKKPITLRVNHPVSPKRLLGLVEEVLLVNNVALTIDDGTVKVIPSDKTKDAVPALMDKSISPLLKYGKVVEIIPIYYISVNDAFDVVRKFLSNSQGGQVLVQHHLYSLMVIANRDDIRRIYQLLAKIDIPVRSASHMALLTPNYVSQDNIINDLNLSLTSAGIPVSAGKTSINGVVLLPLSNNTVLVTASTKSWLKYTLDWAKQLDKPKHIDGSNQGIYVYYMKNTKAADAWSVVSGLFSRSETQDASSEKTAGINLVKAAKQTAVSATPGNQSQGVLPGNSSSSSLTPDTTKSNMSVVTDKYRVVVDSKQNSIFFTGEYQDYQRLVELLKFVDKRPKQILLQATIAEISVEDSYQLGLNLTGTGSDVSGTTALNVGSNITLSGVFGDLTAKFGASLDNAKTHILSNPRVIVLDQETAKIEIGDQIQVLTGSVISGDNSSQTANTYSYVSTGISLEITPSINENGLIELDVNQQVSSVKASAASSSGSGTSPSISKRALSTKMLANNGDTVYMGGLIADTDLNKENKVPLLGDIPLLGSLFKYTDKSQTTTELVLLITPYVINSRDDALFYTKEFKKLTGWEIADYAPEAISE